MMGSLVDINSFDGFGGVDELLGDNEINWSFIVAPLQDIRVPLHTRTVAQVENTSLANARSASAASIF